MRNFVQESILFSLCLGTLIMGCATLGTSPPQSGDDDAMAMRTDRQNMVTDEDISRAPGVSLVDLLRRVPGVQAYTRGDGGIAVRIRGFSSIHASNEPLFVLDGVPVQNVSGSALFGVSPNDIVSIEVLKDAVATAMYGMRGANGIVVITTRRGGL